jgi:hypothetical protein
MTSPIVVLVFDCHHGLFFLIVMRCGCSQIRQTRSRFADSFSSFVPGSRRLYNTLSRHCDTIPVMSRLNAYASALKRSSD